jgi:hypothetical protein
MLYYEKRNNNVNIWEKLLNAEPREWKRILIRKKFEDDSFDDPVPDLFINELNKISSSELENLKNYLFEKMPLRYSNNINERLSDIRKVLNEEARAILGKMSSQIKLNLPLLIFDEAHHLKNSQTQ